MVRSEDHNRSATKNTSKILFSESFEKTTICENFHFQRWKYFKQTLLLEIMILTTHSLPRSNNWKIANWFDGLLNANFQRIQLGNFPFDQNNNWISPSKPKLPKYRKMIQFKARLSNTRPPQLTNWTWDYAPSRQKETNFSRSSFTLLFIRDHNPRDYE